MKTAGFLILLSLTIITGCRKSEIMNAATNNGKDWMKDLKELEIPSFTIKDQYKDISRLAEALSKRKLNTDGTVPNPNTSMASFPTDRWTILDGLNDFKFRAMEQFQSNVFVISPEMGLSIYPGAILDAKSITAENFAPRPLVGIEAYMRPASMSTNLPVGSGKVTKTTILKPSSGRAFVNAALKDLSQLSPGKIAPARFQAEMSSFNTYDKLKMLYGYNKKLDLWAFDKSTVKDVDMQVARRKSGIIIKFFMENFSIDVDVPDDQQLFDSTGMDKSLFMGASPMYVSSVTYGRMGIMTIESESDVSVLQSAIQKKFNILKGVVSGGNNLTQQEIQAMDASIIRYALTGPQGSSAPITISGIAAFEQILSENSSFTAETPGVPISFRLRQLSSHTNVPALFEINYGELDKPFARIEYRDVKAEYKGKQGVHSNVTNWRANIFIACYRTEACLDRDRIQPLNFITFDYTRRETGKNNYDANGNITPGIYNVITSDEMNKETIRNTKGSNILLFTYSNGIPPSFPNTTVQYAQQREGLYGKNDDFLFLIYSGYTLLSGKGYKALPTLKPVDDILYNGAQY
ncbi:thiol-activated cytolysin family protein [Pedobacter gandavensis]|uniref:thiol-activated cytolysin family protein n=1 Tax=Pedobacter gandavensis TaxID=2679963 RepID=UPI002931B8CD|nr:thiol-activated cytolysin family protein [Pedobacter gandavensis]